MKLLATDKLSIFFDIYDCEDNLIIPYIKWADDETGEYVQYVTIRKDGIIMVKGEHDTVKKKGNIYFHPRPKMNVFLENFFGIKYKKRS